MKRFLFCILILAQLFMVCSCQELFKEEKYELLYGHEEIQEISIVNVLAKNVAEYETILIIYDKDAFLDDFEKIMFERFIIGDPTYISSGYAIRILYKNGDCEFINHFAQEKKISGKSHFGRHYCDESEFQALLDKYLEKS